MWKVVLGINNLDHPSEHTQTRGVASVTLHQRYSHAVVDYDISVLELDREVEITSYVRPVCLPRPGQLPMPDTYCYITGWGVLSSKTASLSFCRVTCPELKQSLALRRERILLLIPKQRV